MEIAHVIVFQVKVTMQLASYFEGYSLLSAIIVTIGPRLDYWLQCLIILINVLNLLFYNPDLEQSEIARNLTREEGKPLVWFLPGREGREGAHS